MRRHIDLLIRPRWLIPIEPVGQTLEHHTVAIHQGKIVALLPDHEAQEQFSADTTETLPHHVLIPGLVNLHTHTSTTLLRGIYSTADNRQNTALDSLAQEPTLHEAFIHDSTVLACAEMLRSGITCFSSAYLYPEAVALASTTIGLRTIIGLTITRHPSSYAADVDTCLTRGLASRDHLQNQPLLHFALAPQDLGKLSEQEISRIATLANELDLPIHLSLSNQTPSYTITDLYQRGLINANLLLIDPEHLTHADIPLLAQNGVSIGYSPSKNLNHQSNAPSLLDMLKHEIKLGLSTQHTETLAQIDLLQEARLADLLTHRNTHTALQLATLGGAQALGMESDIGSIRPGKWADLCAIVLTEPVHSPCYSATTHLLHQLNRQNISHVWLAGRKKIDHGTHTAFDKKHLANLISLWQTRLCPYGSPS